MIISIHFCNTSKSADLVFFTMQQDIEAACVRLLDKFRTFLGGARQLRSGTLSTQLDFMDRERSMAIKL